MFEVLVAVFCLVLAVVSPRLIAGVMPNAPRALFAVAPAVFGLLAVLSIFGTSYVHIDKDEVGLVTKIYGGSSLAGGRYIAVNGEQGPQARIIRPGFHVEFLLNVLNKVEHRPNIIVPDGYVGYLVARDGATLRPDQSFADPLDSFVAEGKRLTTTEMLDATTFLRQGGQKGAQTTVLPPGTYPLNTYLWEVVTPQRNVAGMKQIEVPSGFVGVVTSKVHAAINFGTIIAERPQDCTPRVKGTETASNLVAALVPVGCIGVWEAPLLPGRYLINSEAYHVDPFEMRAQTWDYKGGYTRRTLDLEVGQDGSIKPNPGSVPVAKPQDAADSAVFVKVEGWDVPQELRIIAQIPPEFAPRVHTAVGDLPKVENNIITPLVRSVVRNVMGGVILAPLACEEEDKKDDKGNVVVKASCVKGEPLKDRNGKVIEKERPTRVLDLIENRPLLEQNIESILKREGLKAGVDIKEVRLGDPAIPPELLVSRLREQLADQLSKAYRQEKLAQDQRIETENARAKASQQNELVRSVIGVQKAQQNKLAAQLEGEGEKLRLEQIAEGQRAQLDVLGAEHTVELRRYELLLKTIFDFADKYPDVLTAALTNASKFVPTTVVSGGDGGGLSGAAAILGQFFRTPEAPQAPAGSVPTAAPRRQ